MTFAARDLFRHPLTPDELAGLAARAAVSDLFSWRSPCARQRGITPGSLDDAALLALMAEEPRLIRRPLVQFGDILVIGVDTRMISYLSGG